MTQYGRYRTVEPFDPPMQSTIRFAYSEGDNAFARKGLGKSKSRDTTPDQTYVGCIDLQCS